MYDFIKIAEKDDDKGKKMFKELMILYKNVYATKAEADVGGGTRFLVEKQEVEKKNIYNRLIAIQNQ